MRITLAELGRTTEDPERHHHDNKGLQRFVGAINYITNPFCEAAMINSHSSSRVDSVLPMGLSNGRLIIHHSWAKTQWLVSVCNSLLTLTIQPEKSILQVKKKCHYSLPPQVSFSDWIFKDVIWHLTITDDYVYYMCRDGYILYDLLSWNSWPMMTVKHHQRST